MTWHVGKVRNRIDRSIKDQRAILARIGRCLPHAIDATEETFAGLQRLARATGRSPAEVANEAVQRFVEYESWKADKVERGLRAADAGEFASDEEMKAVFDRYKRAADEQG